MQNVKLEIGLKKVFVINKVSILYRGHMLLEILMMKKLLEWFTKKDCKKQVKKSLEFKKVITKKGDKLYVKSKG